MPATKSTVVPKLAEIAERIHAHLKKSEREETLTPSKKRTLCWQPHAYAPGGRVMCSYISYQGSDSLKKAEALRYLTMLDAGYVGRRYEALSEPTPADPLQE